MSADWGLRSRFAKTKEVIQRRDFSVLAAVKLCEESIKRCRALHMQFIVTRTRVTPKPSINDVKNLTEGSDIKRCLLMQV